MIAMPFIVLFGVICAIVMAFEYEPKAARVQAKAARESLNYIRTGFNDRRG